ncbi:MAG: prepilin-type N-terminal cleavage/methylation domain-containing protein [Elusimicrobiaceae bacterium]|nr:prepilin-type N-terminal cleavage/methylation domain-containing protein [Elusimicrobiaceae bacterium]
MKKTSCKRGFTLIELLVVVLIIGILAAVAVPRYQKAVEKSKAAQALTLLKSIVQAEKVFYLANGYYTKHISKLDINIPWEDATTYWSTNWSAFAVANDEWVLQLNLAGEENTGVSLEALALGRLTGKYAGGGFVYILNGRDTGYERGLYCAERFQNGIILSEPGSYCQNLFNRELSYDNVLSMRLYRM